MTLLLAVVVVAVGAAPLEPTVYDVGDGPRAVEVADLDRDGRPDIVVANTGGGTLTLLSPARTIPAGKEPSDVEAVDLDRDGDLDLVVANHETSNVTVLVNDGSAKFAPARGSPIDTGSRPHVHGLATGDFDGDGWLDVAVESADTHAVIVLRGGAKGFAKPLAVPAETFPYHRLGAADVNADGRPDVLVPGNRDRTVRAIVFTDDGPTSVHLPIPLHDQPWIVAGDDVDGDGRYDVIAVHSQAVSVWLARSSGFVPAPGSPFAVARANEVATGDIDGDGIADLAVAPWQGTDVEIVFGGRFERRTIAPGGGPTGLAIADLDGDGRGELLAACSQEDRLVVVPGASLAPQAPSR